MLPIPTDGGGAGRYPPCIAQFGIDAPPPFDKTEKLARHSGQTDLWTVQLDAAKRPKTSKAKPLRDAKMKRPYRISMRYENIAGKLPDGLTWIKPFRWFCCQKGRMKTAWSYIRLLVLCLGVALYGAAANAGMKMPVGGTEMVICADGVALTVYIDANGDPVEPGGVCCNCLDCGHAPVLFANQTSAGLAKPQYPSPSWPMADADVTIVLDTNARPMPRGPPLQGRVVFAHAAQKAVLATFDHSEMYPGHAFGLGGHLLQGCQL